MPEPLTVASLQAEVIEALRPLHDRLREMETQERELVEELATLRVMKRMLGTLVRAAEAPLNGSRPSPKRGRQTSIAAPKAGQTAFRDKLLALDDLGEFTISDLVARIGFHKVTTQRYVRALRDAGVIRLVRQDSGGRGGRATHVYAVIRPDPDEA